MPQDSPFEPSHDSRRELLRRLIGLGLTNFGVAFVGAGLSKTARADDAQCGTNNGVGGVVPDAGCSAQVQGTYQKDGACGVHNSSGYAETDGNCYKQNADGTDTRDFDCSKIAGPGGAHHQDDDCRGVTGPGTYHTDDDCGLTTGAPGAAAYHDKNCATVVSGTTLLARDLDCGKPLQLGQRHSDDLCNKISGSFFRERDADCGLPVLDGLMVDNSCGANVGGGTQYYADARCSLNTPQLHFKDEDCGRVGLWRVEKDDDCAFEHDDAPPPDG